MAIKIDNYVNPMEAISLLQNQQAPSETEIAECADADSYISSISDADKPLNCENYNTILTEFAAQRAVSMDTAESASSDSATSDNESNTSEEAVSSASGESGGGFKGGSSSSSKVVVINGITYLETTTTEDGIKKVTRTVIEGVKGNDAKDAKQPMDDSASASVAALSSIV